MYRRKLRHSRVKNLYKFASSKNNRVLTVESSLEFDACFHFEYSPDISCFEAQPQGFYYQFEGKELPYTPDFALMESSGAQTLVEVKPRKAMDDIDFKARFEKKREAAKAAGINLILVTERQIRVNPILDNLKLLHRYSGLSSLDRCHFTVLDIIKKSGAIKVSSVLEQVEAKEGEVLNSIFKLLQSGRVYADLQAQKLDQQTTVWC